MSGVLEIEKWWLLWLCCCCVTVFPPRYHLGETCKGWKNINYKNFEKNTKTRVNTFSVEREILSTKNPLSLKSVNQYSRRMVIAPPDLPLII